MKLILGQFSKIDAEGGRQGKSRGDPRGEAHLTGSANNFKSGKLKSSWGSVLIFTREGKKRCPEGHHSEDGLFGKPPNPKKKREKKGPNGDQHLGHLMGEFPFQKRGKRGGQGRGEVKLNESSKLSKRDKRTTELLRI